MISRQTYYVARPYSLEAGRGQAASPACPADAFVASTCVSFIEQKSIGFSWYIAGSLHSEALAAQQANKHGRKATPQKQQSTYSTANSIVSQGDSKPKNMADLLAMLENAPAGPVEIDTALLYSPQSSVELSGSSSGSTAGVYASGRITPAVLSRSKASGKSAKQCQVAMSPQPEFSLKAYRPSIPKEHAVSIGEKLVDDWQSPSQGLSDEREYQQGLSELNLLSPADSEMLSQTFCRLSAQQGTAHDAHSLSSPRLSEPRNRASRQLRLDDVIAAGVHGSTIQLLQTGREARLERLAEPRNNLWEKCARLKLEEEQAKLKVST